MLFFVIRVIIGSEKRQGGRKGEELKRLLVGWVTGRDERRDREEGITGSYHLIREI